MIKLHFNFVLILILTTFFHIISLKKKSIFQILKKYWFLILIFAGIDWKIIHIFKELKLI